MRIPPIENRIFDTQVDTNKIFVPMKYSFKLRNYIDGSGLSAVYLHVSHKGKRERIFMDLYANPKTWNKKNSRTTGKSKGDLDLDLLLDNIDSKITEIKTQYRLSSVYLSLEKFMEEFSNGFPRTDFIMFFDAQLKLDRPSFKSEATYKNQKKVLNKLKKFRESIMFGELDMDLIKKFKNWSVLEGNASTTINNSLKIIKKYLLRAQYRGIKFPLNLNELKCGPTTGNRVDLDGVEINKLINYLQSEFIPGRQVIPLVKFLISSFTGMRISDVQQLSHINIVNDRIRFTAIKTGKRQIVQMPITVQDLIKNYPRALTSKITDQEINRVLKDIAKACGIKKVVTFHVARHSFATNYLRLGGKVEILKEILGHSDINETMIYVHIVQEEQDREMMLMDKIVA